MIKKIINVLDDLNLLEVILYRLVSIFYDCGLDKAYNIKNKGLKSEWKT